MMTNEKGWTFDYIGIDLFGAGYSPESCREIVRDLEEARLGRTVCRGQHAPACGPNLLVDVFAAVARPVASAAVSWAVGKLFDSLYRTLATGSSDVTTSRVTLRFAQYDLFLLDESFLWDDRQHAGDSIRFNLSEELLQHVGSFVQSERRKGCLVNSITLPCAIEQGQKGLVCIPGLGSESIWLVDYAEGPRWPSTVYDSANASFIEAEVACVGGDASITGFPYKS